MKKLIISLILILSMSIVVVLADDNVLTISDSEVGNGEEFDIVFSISPVPAAVGSITVSYDNSAIEFEKSEFSEEFSKIYAFINPEYAENQIKFNWLSMDENIDFTDFLTIKFKAKKSGVTEISVLQCDLYDATENPVEIKCEKAVITVSGSEGEPDTEDSSESDESKDTTKPEGNSRPGRGGSTSSSGTGGVSLPSKPVEETKAENVAEENVNITFSDISDYKWAEEAITELARNGIIKGISKTEFAPEKMIKRADFMCLLVRMLNEKAEVKDNFEDVLPDKYYFNELGVAKTLGITKGVGDNKFMPENYISRQEMFTLVYRFLQVTDTVLEDGTREELAEFNDVDMIKEYASIPVAVLVKNNLVSGSNGMILPEKNATRAETAVLIYRLYSRLGN